MGLKVVSVNVSPQLRQTYMYLVSKEYIHQCFYDFIPPMISVTLHGSLLLARINFNPSMDK